MLTIPAVQRACELVEQLACGDVLDGMIDIIHYVPQPKQLELEPDEINRLLGTQIPEADMVDLPVVRPVDIRMRRQSVDRRQPIISRVVIIVRL